MGLFDRLKAYLNAAPDRQLPDGARVNAVALPGTVEELPEWIKVVPVGDFPEHHDGAHEVTEEHLEEMLANFERTSTDLLFDFDHNSIFQGDTKASGWGTELELRDDGLYARQPEWTAAGEAAINGRDYRYLSPVYLLESADKEGNEAGAVLHSVALTNDPYMNEGEIDAIGNASPTLGNEDDDSTPPTQDDSDFMDREELCQKLGLDPETATEEDIDQALQTLQEEDAGEEEDGNEPEGGADEGDDAGADEGDDGGEVAKLNSQLQALQKRLDDRDAQDSEDRAEALVNSAVQSEKILPAQKPVYLNAAKADFEGTKEQLGSLQPGAASPRGVNVQTAGGDSGSDAKVNNRSELVQHLRAERASQG